MSSARSLLFMAALEAAERWPVSKRAALYRALAEFAGCPERSQEFLCLAQALDDADQRCREFEFRFTEGAR